MFVSVKHDNKVIIVTKKPATSVSDLNTDTAGRSETSMYLQTT